MAAQHSEYVLVYYEKIKYVTIGVHQIVTGKRHEHGVLEVGMVLNGAVRVNAHGTSRELYPGDLMLFNAYEPHAITSISREPAQVLTLWISSYFAREYFAGMASTVFDSSALSSLSQEGTEQLRSRIKQASESYFAQSDGFQMECIGHMSLLMTDLYRLLPHKQSTEAENAAKKKKMGRMRRISMYMEQHYKTKLTMSELAKAEGVTTAYMSRVFRELFGMSFQEYLNLLRLERAIPLMRDTSMYLVDICMECGFSDTRYLNAVCQKEFGCNATTYRKELRTAQVQSLSRKLQQGSQEPVCSDEESLQLLRSL